MFVGCQSHRYNLATKDFFSEHELFIEFINNIMVILSNLILVTKLRLLKYFKAKIYPKTTPGSTSAMPEQFLNIKDFILQLEIPKVDALYPDNAQIRDLKILVFKLHNFESETLVPEQDDVTLAGTWALFMLSLI